MDLNFLPPAYQFFAISGRAGFYGPKGTGAGFGVIPQYNDTKIEINSESRSGLGPVAPRATGWHTS